MFRDGQRLKRWGWGDVGNHDISLDPRYDATRYAAGWAVVPGQVEECRELLRGSEAITYLQHAAARVEVPGKGVSLHVFGSPFSPDRGGQNWAFQYGVEEAERLWEEIPRDVDILVTHTPPSGHCDTSDHWKAGGCATLKDAIRRLKPALHICGHCHEGRGAERVKWNEHGVNDADDMVEVWVDPGIGNKKQSIVDLTGFKGGHALIRSHETAIINASIMAKSWGRGGKAFNKPIVVDVDLASLGARRDQPV